MSGKGYYLHNRLPLWVALHIHIIVAVAMSLSCLVGCSQRELCYDHSHKVPVNIEFDWSDAPDAHPATMVVWFFPVDGSHGLRFELIGDGQAARSSFDAVVKVPEGTYRMVCHNGSTEFNVERGSDFNGYGVTTYDVEVLSAMNRNENAPLPFDMPVMSQASPLFSHAMDEPMTVVNEGTTPQKVVFRPVESTLVCDVVVTDVKNLYPAVNVSAVITASDGWQAGSGKSSQTCVAVPFAFKQSGPDELRGSVVLFGFCGEHKLRIYTSYKYYYDFDFTDQITGHEHQHHINIDISGINLPERTSGGLSPGVSEWGETIDESVTM